jgi:Region found in RelA / SpoT proteins
VQDLAGARITVRDLAAQDEARDKINEFYASCGCACGQVDRRKDPRFGYRAVHLVGIDELLVEIQIRTELQNTWASTIAKPHAEGVFGRLSVSLWSVLASSTDGCESAVPRPDGDLWPSRRGIARVADFIRAAGRIAVDGAR